MSAKEAKPEASEEADNSPSASPPLDEETAGGSHRLRSPEEAGGARKSRFARNVGSVALFCQDLSKSLSARRGASSSRSRGAPTRTALLGKLNEGTPEAGSTGSGLRSKAVAQLKAGIGLTKGSKSDVANEEELAEEADRQFKDVVEELGLTANPVVKELGDEQLLAMKRAGTLDVNKVELQTSFKRHKATLGKALFEAETANIMGVELFGMGDFVAAEAYFRRALELTSENKKPAAREVAVLKEFLAQRFDGSTAALYSDLVRGEYPSALGRKLFVEALHRLSYPGDADRVFSMVDSVANDGKVSLPELNAVLKAKQVQLNGMDREPVQKGVVLSNLAACVLQQGNTMDAMQHLRKAARVGRFAAHEGGDTHPNVLTVLTNMAVAYIHLGDLDAALNYIAQVLEAQEKSLGRLSPEVLQLYYLTGLCFLLKANRIQIQYDRRRMDSKSQQNPVEVNYNLAQLVFKETLQRQQACVVQLETRDEDDPVPVGYLDQLKLDIARSHEIIAEIHEKRGELKRALPHLRWALDAKESILSETDPELVSVLNMLAAVCIKSGLNEEALHAMERATAASEEIFGESSLARATEFYYVGLTHFRIGAEQGRAGNKGEMAISLARALEKLQDCHDLRVALLGEETEEVAATAQLMGSIYLANGDRSEARRRFERALLIRLQVPHLGRSHASTASSAHALGCLYGRTPRRQEEAVLLLRKAVHVREIRLGSESLYLADSLHELGSVLLRRHGHGDYEAALQHLARAAKIREKGKLGKRSLVYAASLHQLGQAHIHLGMAMEARPYLQAALALREKLSGKHSAQSSASRNALGIALAASGENDLALKHLRSAYKDRETIFGPSHVVSADSLHQVGLVFVKKECLEEALAPIHRALEVRIQLNEADCKARMEDSDEDPKDLVKKESARTKRVQKRRKLRDLKKRREEGRQRKADDTTQAGSPLASPRGSQGNNFGNAIKNSPGSPHDEESDSEVEISDVGVDIRGFLAPTIADAMQVLSTVYLDMGNFKDSHHWLDRCSCIREEAFGNLSSEFGESMHHFGLLWRSQDKLARALKYFRRALHAREKACGHQHDATASTCAQLAEVLVELGHRDEAGIFMNRALAIKESIYGAHDPDVVAIREKWGGLSAAGMEYDPVTAGEALPHVSRRSAESFLHGFKARNKEIHSAAVEDAKQDPE
ncbi:unnamed protein product [Polarella glacialis]|uniref:Uncharacterized protein n=1 Tax=Polarella glacialis TaxID=89957 RepID=A0A813KAG3_POLGL|nr:unnamed protein product [Polarella glacialis]